MRSVSHMIGICAPFQELDYEETRHGIEKHVPIEPAAPEVGFLMRKHFETVYNNKHLTLLTRGIPRLFDLDTGLFSSEKIRLP